MKHIANSRSYLVGLIVAGASLGISCSAKPEPPVNAANPTGHPEIRTFERWLNETGYPLSEAEQRRLDNGEALLGIVPKDELPLLHAHAGVVEMGEELFERHGRGELDFTKDFDAWAAAGLYDPRSPAQVTAARRAVGDEAILELDEAVAFAAFEDDKVPAPVPAPDVPPAPPNGGWNCRYIVTMAATLTNNPAATTTTPSTRTCRNYGGNSSSHYIGGAPAIGADAYGGWYTGANSTNLSASCQELGHEPGASQSIAVSRPIVWGTEALDPAFALRCPTALDFGVQADVSARAESRLRGNLHVEFRKAYQQWNPIGGFFRSPWRGVASGQVEAFVDDSWRKATANGAIMIGSNCQSTLSGSFSATVGQGGASVGPSAGVWNSCSTESWPSASVPRDQPLEAHVQNATKTLRLTLSPAAPNGQNQTFSAGVKGSDFKAEAWSASPAESSPWDEVYDMQSKARSNTTGGCIELAYEACNITVQAGPGIACRIGAPATASYSTNNGVDCMAQPVPMPQAQVQVIAN